MNRSFEALTVALADTCRLEQIDVVRSVVTKGVCSGITVRKDSISGTKRLVLHTKNCEILEALIVNLTCNGYRVGEIQSINDDEQEIRYYVNCEYDLQPLLV